MHFRDEIGRLFFFYMKLLKHQNFNVFKINVYLKLFIKLSEKRKYDVFKIIY